MPLNAQVVEDSEKEDIHNLLDLVSKYKLRTALRPFTHCACLTKRLFEQTFAPQFVHRLQHMHAT